MLIKPLYDPLAHHDGDTVIAGEGTALLPSYTFSGDLDTGMWHPTSNEIAWSVDGTEFMRVSSAGLDLSDNPIVDVGYIDLNLTNGIAPAEGRLVWNDDDGTLNLGMKGGFVNLQIGQEQLIRGKNTVGSQINDGMAVRISGTGLVGSNPFAEFGLADSDNPIAAGSIGVATEDIANNQFGYVTTFGFVRDFDTSGTPVSEVWSDADRLYVSDTPGELTNVAPSADERKIFIGIVIRAHANEGVVWVNPINVSYPHELSGVDPAALADNVILQYDSGTSTWPLTSFPTFDALVLDGTEDIGLDMSSGTFTAIQKWPTGTIYIDQSLTINDPTATTGKTSLILMAGAADTIGGSELLSIRPLSGSAKSFFAADNNGTKWQLRDATGRHTTRLSESGLTLASGAPAISWTSGDVNAGKDTELLREAAGAVRVRNASSAYGDFYTENLFLYNNTHSDADGGGATVHSFLREDGAGTPSTAATITASHDGAVANDTDGKLVIATNLEGTGLVDHFKIDSAGSTFIGDAGVTNHTVIASNGDVSFSGSAGFYPRRINQADIPTSGTGATQIDINELIVWRDSDDGTIRFVYNDTDSGIVSVVAA
ncbi:hypothetical protein KAR91_32370 [Candidatus Pacearchaeota archaeon]|nr:hypothetical protein [Candidatus Pacearchaeota archaeon]